MSADLVIGVLALQGDFREHLGALAQVGARARSVRRSEDLLGLSGLILPGGESTTIDKLARAFGVHEPLRSAISQGLPVYGSCAGLIGLADRLVDGPVGQGTFGGLDISVRRNAFGRQVASFEAELAVAGLFGPPVRGVFIRAPWVEDIGPQVQVLATITQGPATGRIVAVRQGSLLATSFHPEVTADRRIHEFFLDLVRASAWRAAVTKEQL